MQAVNVHVSENLVVTENQSQVKQAKEKHEEAVKHFSLGWAEREKALDLFGVITDADMIRKFPNWSSSDIKSTELRAALAAAAQAGATDFCWELCMVFNVGDPDKMITVKYRPDESRVMRKEEDDDGDEDLEKVEQDTEKNAFARRTAFCIGAFKAIGLETFEYLSVQRDEIYCLLGATEAWSKKTARKLIYPALLDPIKLREVGAMCGLALAEAPELAEADIWRNIYAQFDDFPPENPRSSLYMRRDDNGSLFRPIDRIKLMIARLQSESLYGGANLPVRKFITLDDHPLLACYPFHDLEIQNRLKAQVMNWSAVFRPPAELKEYFGEELGMYFAFLSCYTRYLVPISIIGTPFFFYQIHVKYIADGERLNSAAVISFAAAVALWSTLFLEVWKRKQARLRVEWGMQRTREVETPRPEFDGDWQISTITGELVEYFHPSTYRMRLGSSQCAVLIMIIAVLGLVIGLFMLRAFMIIHHFLPPGQAMLATSVVNFIQIFVANMLYTNMANWLNNWENHRTDREFNDSLINKSFWFKFFNSYNSLIYISFVKAHDQGVGYCAGSWEATKRHLLGTLEGANPSYNLADAAEDFYYSAGFPIEPVKNINASVFWSDCCLANVTECCGYTDEACAAGRTAVESVMLEHGKGPDFRGDCFNELFVQLAIIFVLNLTLNNFLEVVVPWIKTKLAERRENAEVAPKKSKLEKGYAEMDNIATMAGDSETLNAVSQPSEPEKQFVLESYEGTFGDYDELIVQFGYVVLFVLAFPLAPLLAFVNNVVEFRIDAMKLLTLYRRPIPRNADNIGDWENKLRMLSWICMITNLALIFFTADAMDKSMAEKLVYFIAIEHLLFGIKIVVDWAVPDQEQEIHDLEKRSDHISDVLMTRDD